MDTTAYNEPEREGQDEMSTEDELDLRVHSFVVDGTTLATCPLLPEKLRELIGEAVRAAKGCRSCKMPLGALHALDCSETRYEWDLYKLRRVVATHDLSIYLPNEELPSRPF